MTEQAGIMPHQFFKCLADPIRLTLLIMLDSEGELCVCELTHALKLSQPKISRHLALLRNDGLLTTRKVGKWVYYQIAQQLPQWQKQCISSARLNNFSAYQAAQTRMNEMTGRPERTAFCCQ